MKIAKSLALFTTLRRAKFIRPVERKLIFFISSKIKPYEVIKILFKNIVFAIIATISQSLSTLIKIREGHVFAGGAAAPLCSPSSSASAQHVQKLSITKKAVVQLDMQSHCKQIEMSFCDSSASLWRNNLKTCDKNFNHPYFFPVFLLVNLFEHIFRVKNKNKKRTNVPKNGV